MSTTFPVPSAVTQAVAQAVNADPGSGAAAAAVLAFHALTPDETTYEMLGVSIGTGALTTTHTSNLYTPDGIDNNYRLFGTNEPVYSGGRVVKNALCNGSLSTGMSSEDLTSLPIAFTLPTDFETIVWAAGSSTTAISTCFSATSAPCKAGQELFISFDVLAGTTVQQLGVRFSLHGSLANSVDLSGGSFPFRVGVTVTATSATIGDITFGTRGIEGGDTLGGTMKMTNLQVEVLDPGATVPSEYVQAIGDGKFVVTKTFASTNGNTILNDVVTEAVGTPLAEAPYLQYYPAATNALIWSRDFRAGGTNSIWDNNTSNSTATYDQIGLTGEPNTATESSDTGAPLANHRQLVSSVSGTKTITGKIWVKKTVGDPNVTCILTGLTGGTNSLCHVIIDTNTGSWIPRSGTDDASAAREVIDAGDWWLILCQVTDNASGNSSITCNIYPAWATTLTETWAAALTGTKIVGNFELHENKTIAQVRGLGPIFTTTAAVSTDETLQEVDDANQDNTEGGWYAEIIPSFASAEVTGDLELLSLNAGADLLYYDGTNSQVESADGTNVGVKSLTTVAATAYQIAVAFGSSKMKINVDGTWGALQTYDGAYPAGTAIDIMRAMGYGCEMRNLRFYAGTYAAVQTAIEALMP